MRILSWIRSAWKGLRWRADMEREMDAELRFHVEAYAADLTLRGMPREAAMRKARVEFGGMERAKEQCREARGIRFAETLAQDLRYAVRMLGKNRGMTVGVILAIALGIGVNTGIFTLLNAVALRPLAVRDARRVVSVYQTFRGSSARNVNGAASLFSYAEYLDYRDHNHVFTGLLANKAFFSASLDGEQPRRVEGQLISCNYFDVLNIRPVIGRGLTESDCSAPGTAPVVVLSDGFWHGAFNADPNMVGKVITLNRVQLTVVGIAPTEFRGTEPVAADFWAPVSMQPVLDASSGNSLADDNLSWLVLMGRLDGRTSLARVRADLGVIAGRIDQHHPGRTTTLAVNVASFFGESEMRGYLVGAGAIVLAAVSLVLLIVCANVANLLLARASGRQKEIAVRLALGAGRGRLIRQLLTESLLLALIGGVLGSVAAFWSFEALVRLLLAHVPAGVPTIALSVRPDLRVLAYALVLTVTTGIIFGLAPALQASKPELNLALKEEGAGRHGYGSRSWLRSALVTAQVSVCLILLLTAGLLGRGLREAQTIDPGFATKDVSVLTLDLDQQNYDGAKATAFQRELIEKIGALPGVDAVAQASVVPLSLNSNGSGVRIGGGERIQVRFNKISTEYFEILGIPIVGGRNFSETELRGAAKVAIVTEATARRLWPYENALGKAFQFQDGAQTYSLMQVVGIVKDARTSSLGADDDYFFYFPASPEDQLKTALLTHGRAPLATAAKGIRETVRGIDSRVMADVRPLDVNLENYRLPSRIVTVLFSVLGLLALLLASIGIYGVVAYIVSQRTREIGIRMTLGASASEIVRLVLRGSMRPAILGMLIGVGCCAGVSRIFSSLLFGVSPFDPITFVGVPIFLLVVALLASYLPARRATRVDPTVALKYE